MSTVKKTNKQKQINKISLAKHKVSINYTETILVETYEKSELTGEENLIAEEKNFIHHTVVGDHLPHPDFVTAMKMLRKTVIEANELKDSKKFDKYEVIGVSYNGEQDDAKVIITYQKLLEWCGKLTPACNTVPIPLFDNEYFGGSKEVDKLCSTLNREAWAYLEGKHEETPQLNLQFENGERINMKVMADGSEDSNTDESEDDGLPFKEV